MTMKSGRLNYRERLRLPLSEMNANDNVSVIAAKLQILQ